MSYKSDFNQIMLRILNMIKRAQTRKIKNRTSMTQSVREKYSVTLGDLSAGVASSAASASTAKIKSHANSRKDTLYSSNKVSTSFTAK